MKATMLTASGMGVLLLIVAAALAIFYTYLYRREARQTHGLAPNQQRILRILRIAVAVLALLALSRPAITLVKHETRTPVVGILVDESSSMAFPDARENPLAQAATRDQRRRWDTAASVVQKLQEKLTRSHRVQVFAFSDTLRLLKELPKRSESDPAIARDELFAKTTDPNGDYTNIGDGLGDALRELSGNRVSGLVLLSDGRQTGGRALDESAAQAADAKVPVHTIVLGSEFPLRDLSIDDVAALPEVSLGDVLVFRVKIKNQVQPNLSTKLTLFEQGQRVNERKLVLPRGESQVTIATIASTEGTREFKLELPKYEDEVNVENNQAIVHVRVVKRTLRVLLIAGTPNREYFYLAPALLRDPVIDLSCFLQTADVDYAQQGKTSLERLPRSVEEWKKFDVVILLDVDPNRITTQQVAEMENMVHSGGGLMVIAGRGNGLAKLIQVHAVKVREMLPIEVDKNLLPNYLDVLDKPFKAERTPKGRGHPVMRLERDDRANEAVWSTFPQFYWANPVARLKPQSVSLLERADADKTTLMAIHRYYEGAVFYCGLDSLWLWRYPNESYDYDRFWTNIIRYLGETRLRGSQQQVALNTDRNSYSPGEDVQLRLRVLDPALMAQLEGQTIYASVTSPQKDVQMVPLKADSSGEMLYVGSYRARRLGSMVVRAKQAAPDASSAQKPLFDVEHAFAVKMQSLENRDTSADMEAMKALSKQTGGRYYDYHNMSSVADLADVIPKDPQVLTQQLTLEIWDGSVFLSLFLALIGTEWALRKLWGLL